jgi:receptor protein-tyrosine kinase
VGLLENDDGRRVTDFVFKTNHPSLYFLPAGASRSNAKELLGSQRMRAFIGDLTAHREHFVVVFDSPPLLLTSEARVIASYVGQIGLVVEAGVTPRRSLLEAIELLDGTKAINLILNKNRQTFGMGDSYHYGQPYGSDGEHSRDR